MLNSTHFSIIAAIAYVMSKLNEHIKFKINILKRNITPG